MSTLQRILVLCIVLVVMSIGAWYFTTMFSARIAPAEQVSDRAVIDRDNRDTSAVSNPPVRDVDDDGVTVFTPPAVTPTTSSSLSISISTDDGSSTAPLFESEPALPAYTLAEVARHATADDCWTTINGKVYDITNYIPDHPDGLEVTELACGIDGTELYESESDHSNPNGKAAAALAELYVGELSE